jgi:hypothetical protein
VLAGAHWAERADRRDDLLLIAQVLSPNVALPEAPHRQYMAALLAGQGPDRPAEPAQTDLREIRRRQLVQAAARGELDDDGRAELEGMS